MGYDVSVHHVKARPLAAARDTMPVFEIPRRFKASLDKVWAFLKTRPELRGDGHNVFLYHHDGEAPARFTIDFGVEVTGAFESEGDVHYVTTPDGEAATTMHVGPYDKLQAGHDALHAWVAANGRRIGAFSWEVYGDWNDDPSKLETQIFYLLQ